jgi:hypothetical protein
MMRVAMVEIQDVSKPNNAVTAPKRLTEIQKTPLVFPKDVHQIQARFWRK